VPEPEEMPREELLAFVGEQAKQIAALTAIVTATNRGNSALRVIRRSSRHHDD
jgi:type II secretory pathway component PulM